MTSFDQLVTTAYGRTLVIKILLFLLMAGISAYHAFFLRPRLASALTTDQSAPLRTIPAGVTLASYGVPAEIPVSQGGVAAGGDDAISGGARKLAGRLEDWLRR